MFSIRVTNNLMDGKLIYNRHDYSFAFFPNKATDITLLIDCLQLNIDSISKKLCTIDGFHSYTVWRNRSLVIPDYQIGEVYLNENLESGDIKKIISNVSTFYDKNNGIICIGNPNYLNSDNIKISKDIILSITDGELVSLWLTPEII